MCICTCSYTIGKHASWTAKNTGQELFFQVGCVNSIKTLSSQMNMKLSLECYLALFCCKLRNLVKYALLCYCWCSLFRCPCYFLLFFKLCTRNMKLLDGREGFRSLVRRQYWRPANIVHANIPQGGLGASYEISSV